MGTLSLWHILLLAGVALLLFGGRGRIPELMGDVAKGIKSFRQGLSDPPEDPKTINSSPSDKDKTAGQ
ncbi:MAG: twin-arginine translocase TatA/TatE family subunit [Proteobacteria bacterium]|nr:twin-arginine translocase TatA/TatE family subunit [Pseudomonadota bacterium]